jgi:hypothetical protein
MEIIFSHDLDFNTIRGLNRCRGSLEAMFLSDITTIGGRYLEYFVFSLGGKSAQLHYKFLQEQLSKQDWDSWINFWHAYTTTGGKLKTTLGRWNNKTHRI